MYESLEYIPPASALTAKGKAPTTYEEAVRAFEAAYLAKLAKKTTTPSKGREDRFEARLRKEWSGVEIHEFRRNRGTVVVTDILGRRCEVMVMVALKSRENSWVPRAFFRPGEDAWGEHLEALELLRLHRAQFRPLKDILIKGEGGYEVRYLARKCMQEHLDSLSAFIKVL